MNQVKNQYHQKSSPATRVNLPRLNSYRNVPFWKPLWGQSQGNSLPVVLITLAVGSILLTGFLSFVSSRAKGTETSTEIFNEGYAADAGIEFGIWSLLYNSTFRSQVDTNAGIPQALTFPGTINGSTPTISVTGIPLGRWFIRTSADWKIKAGGSLAYDGGNRVYALRGDKKDDFGYYRISNSNWYPRNATPEKVKQGGSLVYAGGDYLYAMRGDKKKDFWQFDINNNSWSSLRDTPEKVDEGGSLVYGGGNFIYALRGKSDEFWRYNINTNQWATRDNTPFDVGNGADLVFDGANSIYAFQGDGEREFWRYDISSDNWITTLADVPGNIDVGGSLAYYGGNYLYALQGKSQIFWRYSINTDSWTSLTNTPAKVGAGGDMVFTHSEGGFAIRGDKKVDFWEFEVTPPRYDISSLAGAATIDTRLEIDGPTKTILFWDIE
jgi:hypothetical protein